MEAEILETLQEIRGILYVLMIGFGVLIFLVVVSTITSTYITIKDRLKIDFTDKVKGLFEKQKYKEIITLSTKELELFPRSAEANWWLARAYSHLGNDLEALKLFKKVTELELHGKQNMLLHM